MNQDMIIDVAREALLTVISVAGPLLLLALTVGLLVSIFQTVTSIQEPTLAFVPKILAVFLGLVLFGPWMLNKLLTLITSLYSKFGSFIIN
ncbi:flagellar biosynthesis protein FliQ [Vallitalea sediminicola]|jgi:flagellar biosynthetic protein FliQ|uniref:Flagellar biosynthetic protein FliQ n=2 Tax=Vallitalea TaxID=1348611 RepID=A0A8J8MF16_9FIRM|nr:MULTISPECIES: flagellar biosynthesis protein FliQ [Vallitalea]MCT4688240.1 flagellar biosynthesis protein FliQ [Vallitalea sp.]QUH31455.1 flagellar biosynthesis protein FliQ [Vallitalea guaymasensis]GMQ62765.1 flagellar biosynthesis protein FliQ [Vallitalea sp. AN17-2]